MTTRDRKRNVNDLGRGGNARWFLLATGTTLLAMAVWGGVDASRRAEAHERDQGLLQQVAIQSQLIEEYFDRATTVMKLSVENEVFHDFGVIPGSVEDKLASADSLLAGVNDALTNIEELYPNQTVNEVCLIDGSGAEYARSVRSHLAHPDELSQDESANLFFNRTLALAPGQVHQGKAYLSPDTNDWVISNSALVPLADGSRNILHFEVTLDSFRGALAESGDHHTMIVDADTAAIILDFDSPLVAGGPLGDPDDTAPPALLQAAATSGLTEFDGRRFAFQRIQVAPDNDNNWFIVTDAPITQGLWRHFSGEVRSLVLTGLLVLGYAVYVWRRHNVQLATAAVTDDLTGLPNRRLLHDRIGAGIRGRSQSAVLLIDLNHFKDVNDTLGHQKGDQLLMHISSRLRGAVSGADTVARLGGDEFCVFLSSITSVDDAIAAARRLLSVIEAPFTLDSMTARIGGSIGIACFPADGDTTELLLQHADVAMYCAKRRHEGFAIYRAENDRHTERRLRLAGELGAAIENGDLVVHYQPKIDLASGDVAGVEALVRWRHPSFGLIPPDEFISIAEDTGLINALTMNVLDQTLERCRRWKEQGVEQYVAINLSARSLLDTGLPDAVADRLRRWGIDGTSITFEITESAIIDDHETAAAICHGLSRLGIRLSIDDFGTGYFSMSGLRNLPIDEIKIDRAFVSSMTSEEKDAFIVHSTITLGKSLGLRVVAEGVEDEATLAELRALGCDFAQGFLMSRPMEGDQLVPWIRTWRRSRLVAGTSLTSELEAPPLVLAAPAQGDMHGSR